MSAIEGVRPNPADRPNADAHWLGLAWDILSQKTRQRGPQGLLLVYQLILAHPEVALQYAPRMLQILQPWAPALFFRDRRNTVTQALDGLEHAPARFISSLARVARAWDLIPAWRTATKQAFENSFRDVCAVAATLARFRALPSTPSGSLTAINVKRALRLTAAGISWPVFPALAPDNWSEVPDPVEWQMLWTQQRTGVHRIGDHYILHLPTLLEDCIQPQEFNFYCVPDPALRGLPVAEAARALVPAARHRFTALPGMEVRPETLRRLLASPDLPETLGGMRDAPDEFIIAHRNRLSELVHRAWSKPGTSIAGFRKPRIVGTTLVRRTLRRPVPAGLPFESLRPGVTSTESVWRDEAPAFLITIFNGVSSDELKGPGAYRVNRATFATVACLSAHAEATNQPSLAGAARALANDLLRAGVSDRASWEEAWAEQQRVGRKLAGTPGRPRPHVFVREEDELILRTWRPYLREWDVLEAAMPGVPRSRIRLRGQLLRIVRGARRDPVATVHDEKLLRHLLGRNLLGFAAVLPFRP